MRRREFIAGLGNAAAWPVVARALQVERAHSAGARKAALDAAVLFPSEDRWL
jgi:hypothetical protein